MKNNKSWDMIKSVLWVYFYHFLFVWMFLVSFWRETLQGLGLECHEIRVQVFLTTPQFSPALFPNWNYCKFINSCSWIHKDFWSCFLSNHADFCEKQINNYIHTSCQIAYDEMTQQYSVWSLMLTTWHIIILPLMSSYCLSWLCLREYKFTYAVLSPLFFLLTFAVR